MSELSIANKFYFIDFIMLYCSLKAMLRKDWKKNVRRVKSAGRLAWMTLKALEFRIVFLFAARENLFLRGFQESITFDPALGV